MLCHTNLEYRVIANHLSASGLRLAPHLTHASSGQRDNRGAGDSAHYNVASHCLFTSQLPSLDLPAVI